MTWEKCRYGCSQQVWYDEATHRRFNDEQMTIKHPYHVQNEQPTTSYKPSYTPKPKVDQTARAESMKQMQESKQKHELEIQKSNDNNAEKMSKALESIAKSNEPLAIALNKVAEGLMELARSKKLGK